MKRQLGKLFKVIDDAQTKLEQLEQETSSKLQNLKKKIQRVSLMNVVKSSDSSLILHWQFVRSDGSIKFLGNRPKMIHEIKELIEHMESGEDCFITGLRKLTIFHATEVGGFDFQSKFQMPDGAIHHVKLEKLEHMPTGTSDVPVVGYYQPFAD